MSRWEPIERDQVRDWLILAATAGLAAYRVAPPWQSLGDVAEMMREWNVEAQYEQLPGGIEIDYYPSGPPIRSMAADLSRLVEIVDRRGLSGPPGDGLDGPYALELRTLVDGVGTIGAGGRVHVGRGALRPGGRIVLAVRSRHSRINTVPMDVAAVLASIDRWLPPRQLEPRLWVAYGHYEASIYEDQTWLRPAIAITADLAGGRNAPPRRFRLVAPVTTLPDDAAGHDGTAGISDTNEGFFQDE